LVGEVDGCPRIRVMFVTYIFMEYYYNLYEVLVSDYAYLIDIKK